MSEVLKKRIREHEGFRDTPYLDSLGKATIGYGHLITDEDEFEEGKQYPKDELLKLFDKDFEKAEMGAEQLVGSINGQVPRCLIHVGMHKPLIVVKV